MILDSEDQRAMLLEMIARAHRSPAEVVGVELIRAEVAGATVASEVTPGSTVTAPEER